MILNMNFKDYAEYVLGEPLNEIQLHMCKDLAAYSRIEYTNPYLTYLRSISNEMYDYVHKEGNKLTDIYKMYLLNKDRENGMTLNEYQKLAARTINTTTDDTQDKYHALHGMSGEIGEIHSIYQKLYQGHEMDETHLKKEFGDLMWFIAEYCTAAGWTLEEICKMNVLKLKERYPDGFEENRSLNRAVSDV